MPTKDNPKTEEQASQSQASQPPPATGQASDMRSLLNTLDRVFSTFRKQLQSETPNPFNDDAQIAVATFNDIVARLRFETRPQAFTIAPGKLSATQIELTWTDVVGNADGYRVERCQGGGCNDLAEVGRAKSTERSFTDSNLSPSTTYRYQVVAFNFRGEKPSNILPVQTTST